MSKHLVAALCCTLSLLPIACNKAMKNTDPQAIDAVMAERYRADGPGAAVLVAHGDTILYEGYRGVADMGTGDKIDAHTRFNIASCSKQFTVVALMQCLAEHGGSMDDPVTKYLPEYTNPIWQGITLTDLAGHTSGLPDARDRSDRQATVLADDDASVAYFDTLDTTQFAPGTAYDYLNPSFILLARVVERLSGQPFTEYVQQHIFDPLGMDETYYFDPDAAPACQSHGYVLQPDSTYAEYDYGEETFFATRPDGGIYSTARDLLRWERGLATGAVLPADQLAQAYAKRADVAASPYCDYQRRPNTWYGQGWFVEDTPNGTRVYHTGDNGGYQAYIGKYPYAPDGKLDPNPLTVIILENTNHNSRRDLYQQIEELFNVQE